MSWEELGLVDVLTGGRGFGVLDRDGTGEGSRGKGLRVALLLSVGTSSTLSVVTTSGDGVDGRAVGKTGRVGGGPLIIGFPHNILPNAVRSGPGGCICHGRYGDASAAARRYGGRLWVPDRVPMRPKSGCVRSGRTALGRSGGSSDEDGWRSGGLVVARDGGGTLGPGIGEARGSPGVDAED